MLDHGTGVAELQNSISSLHKRIENAKGENERLRTRIQASLHEKGGTALTEAIQACTKAAISSSTLQDQLAVAEKKVAVKDDILLPLKAQKLEWANDKNCERKTLLLLLGIGLNVLEVGPEVAKIEFVVNSLRIVTNYSCAEEKFSRKSMGRFYFGLFINSISLSVITIEPPVANDAMQEMQQLLAETNDICGLLSAAKKKQV